MDTIIEFIQADITSINVDVIVNAANKTLLGGGGVDGAIHRAAGEQLLAECVKLGGCRTGEAKITKGFNLPSRYVIHTVGPVWQGGKYGEENNLADCYRNSLQLAKDYALKTIAFPSISTGAYHFPKDLAVLIALNTTKIFLKNNPDVFAKILFVLFSTQDLELYKRNYTKIFNDES